jgi:3-oxoacyl-[acyl-carrier-protein] synthase III
MAETLYLNDNAMAVILSDKDFTDLVFDYMGSDAENKVREYIRLSDEAEHAVETDLASYESSLESNTACFNEVLEIVKQIRNTARLEKSKLHKLLNEIEKLISNQI